MSTLGCMGMVGGLPTEIWMMRECASLPEQLPCACAFSKLDGNRKSWAPPCRAKPNVGTPCMHSPYLPYHTLPDRYAPFDLLARLHSPLLLFLFLRTYLSSLPSFSSSSRKSAPTCNPNPGPESARLAPRVFAYIELCSGHTYPPVSLLSLLSLAQSALYILVAATTDRFS
ncbi:hypothetical protein VTK26DRAFT_1713 [Humicola hyalothermophila]